MNEVSGKEKSNESTESGNRETNNESLVVLTTAILFCRLLVKGLTIEKASFSAKVVVVTSRKPGVTETLLDGHFMNLPFVELGMVRLTVVVLAEQASTGFALVKASFHDEETFTGLRHGATTIPLVAFTIGFIESLDTLHGGTVAAGS